jgi:hypothetical protein
MKKKKRDEIVELALLLGRVKTYEPADLGADLFRKISGVASGPELRCILVSTRTRDRIIKLLCERL